MSEYTPTTQEIRNEWAGARANSYALAMEHADAIAEVEFDRWLAEVERAAAEKAVGEVFLELLPVLEEAVSNAYLCKHDRGISDEWDDEIERAETAVARAETYRRNEGENDGQILDR